MSIIVYVACICVCVCWVEGGGWIEVGGCWRRQRVGSVGYVVCLMADVWQLCDGVLGVGASVVCHGVGGEKRVLWMCEGIELL